MIEVNAKSTTRYKCLCERERFMLKMLILAHKICNTNISLFTLLLNYQHYLKSALKNEQQIKTIVAQQHIYLFLYYYFFPRQNTSNKEKDLVGFVQYNFICK